MKLAHITLFTFLSLISVVGCGPKIISAPGISDQRLSALAILPPTYTTGVRRERVDYIHASFKSLLENAGFGVLDENLVKRICQVQACTTNRAAFDTYKVDALVELRVDSIARNNFFAGYYNIIAGSLLLSKTDGVKLIKIEHTERERGGLLFNSGQLIEGIRTQIKNSGDDSFNALANEFVRTLVLKLPKPAATAETFAVPPEIRQVKADRIRRTTFRICAEATPGVPAYLLMAKQKTNLRETAPGVYCGIYFVPPELASNLSVELRSSFGETVQKQVMLPVSAVLVNPSMGRVYSLRG